MQQSVEDFDVKPDPAFGMAVFSTVSVIILAIVLVIILSTESTSAKGPQGPQGPKGDQGLSIKGDKGDSGDPGTSIKGDKGDKGDTGPSGESTIFHYHCKTGDTAYNSFNGTAPKGLLYSTASQSFNIGSNSITPFANDSYQITWGASMTNTEAPGGAIDCKVEFVNPTSGQPNATVYNQALSSNLRVYLPAVPNDVFVTFSADATSLDISSYSVADAVWVSTTIAPIPTTPFPFSLLLDTSAGDNTIYRGFYTIKKLSNNAI